MYFVFIFFCDFPVLISLFCLILLSLMFPVFLDRSPHILFSVNRIIKLVNSS